MRTVYTGQKYHGNIGSGKISTGEKKILITEARRDFYVRVFVAKMFSALELYLIGITG